MIEKRSMTDNLYLTTNVLLELEGICIQNNFRKEQLTYVQQQLEEYINKNWENESFQEVVQILREEAKLFEQQALEGFIAIPERDDETKKAVLENVLWQIKNKQDSVGFKKIKEIICEDGYKSGNLKPKLCEDFDMCLNNWSSEGKKIFIISSYKVDEQKLILSNTEKGDFIPVISGYFDEDIGPRNVKDTYSKIVEKVGCAPSDLMFVSDKFESVLAASTSGLVTLLTSKDSTANQSSSIALINSISNIEFQSSNKKRKVCSESIEFSVSNSIQENKATTSTQTLDLSEKNINGTGKDHFVVETEQNNLLTEKSNNMELDSPEEINSNVQCQHPVTDTEFNSNTKKRKICNESKEFSLPHDVQESTTLNVDIKDNSEKHISKINDNNDLGSKFGGQTTISNAKLGNGDTVLSVTHEDSKNSISDNEFHSSIKRPKISNESTELSSLHDQELQSTSSSDVENVNDSKKKLSEQDEDGTGKAERTDSNGPSKNSMSDTELKSGIEDKQLCNESMELSPHIVEELQTNYTHDVEIVKVSNEKLTKLSEDTRQDDVNEKDIGVENKSTSEAEGVSMAISPLTVQGPKSISSDDVENANLSDNLLNKLDEDNLEIKSKEDDMKENFNEVDNKSTSDAEKVIVSSNGHEILISDTEFGSNTTNKKTIIKSTESFSLQAVQEVQSSTSDDPENKDVSVNETKQGEDNSKIKTEQDEKSIEVETKTRENAEVITVSSEVGVNSISDTEFKSGTTDVNNIVKSVDISPITVQEPKSSSSDTENTNPSDIPLTKMDEDNLEIKNGEGDMVKKFNEVDEKSTSDAEKVIVSSNDHENIVSDTEFGSSTTNQKNIIKSTEPSSLQAVQSSTLGDPENKDVSVNETKQGEDDSKIKTEQDEKSIEVENKSRDDAEVITVSSEVAVNSISDTEFKSSSTDENIVKSVDISPITVQEPKSSSSVNADNMNPDIPLTKMDEDHLEMKHGEGDVEKKFNEVDKNSTDDAEKVIVLSNDHENLISDTEFGSSTTNQKTIIKSTESSSLQAVQEVQSSTSDNQENMDISDSVTKQGEDHLEIKTGHAGVNEKSSGVENSRIGDSVEINSNGHSQNSISVVEVNSNTDHKNENSESTELLPSNSGEELKSLSSGRVLNLKIELGQGDVKEKSSEIETNSNNVVFGNGDVVEIDLDECIKNSNSNSNYKQEEMTPVAVETKGIKQGSVENLKNNDESQTIEYKNVDVEERATSNGIKFPSNESDKLHDENAFETDLETLTEGIKKTDNKPEKLDESTKNVSDSIILMPQGECSEIIKNCSSEENKDIIPEKPSIQPELNNVGNN